MGRAREVMLIAPALLVVGLFMVLPLGVALAYSFLTASATGGANAPLTWDGYLQILFDREFDDTLIFTSDYLAIVLRSVLLAASTTAACLLVALPVAWFMAWQPPRRRQLLVFLVTVPLWTNLLIRTYCWILILRNEGLLNGALGWLGLISAPLPLLYGSGTILLGMTYAFLPFMVLPIFAALQRMDKRLIEAGYDLYASRWHVLRRVVWPTAKPGAYAGSLLVFAPALGAYLVPDLLGGGKQMLIGNLIQNQFSSGRNWPFGAALAVVLTLMVLLGVVLQARRSAMKGRTA